MKTKQTITVYAIIFQFGLSLMHAAMITDVELGIATTLEALAEPAMMDDLRLMPPPDSKITEDVRLRNELRVAADDDPNATNHFEQNPLMEAIEIGDKEIIFILKLIGDQRLNITHQDNDGKTAPMYLLEFLSDTPYYFNKKGQAISYVETAFNALIKKINEDSDPAVLLCKDKKGRTIIDDFYLAGHNSKSFNTFIKNIYENVAARAKTPPMDYENE